MRGHSRSDALAPILIALSSTGLFFGPALLQTITLLRLTFRAVRGTM